MSEVDPVTTLNALFDSLSPRQKDELNRLIGDVVDRVERSGFSKDQRVLVGLLLNKVVTDD